MNIDPEKSEVREETVDADSARWMSRRSYLTLLAGFAGSVAGWKWLKSTSKTDNTPWPLREAFQFNEKVSNAVYSPERLSPTFPESRIDPPRQNGIIGLQTAFDPVTWRLRVSGLRDGAPAEFSLAEIKAMPRTEVVTELRCIEGWSLVVKWAGVAMKDLVKLHPHREDAGFLGATTPDGEYYVGLDLPVALHPQTLLCYEMNDEPLSYPHGAPLRLAVPGAYGIKHLKRMGSMAFAAERPPDYWAERGYDYYSAQ